MRGARDRAAARARVADDAEAPPLLSLRYAARARADEGGRFGALVGALAPGARAPTALRRDVLLLLNTLLAASAELDERLELRAELAHAGLLEAIGGSTSTRRPWWNAAQQRARSSNDGARPASAPRSSKSPSGSR